MTSRIAFERNLLALASGGGDLAERLTAATTTSGRYRFLEAKTGDIVPAVVDRTGSARPLHSLVDPAREASRLISTVRGSAYLVILGLGGGYAARAALDRDDIRGLLVIEYGADGTAELLASKDYVDILRDPRFRLLVDPTPSDIEAAVMEDYHPAFAGGIATLPLRPRADADPEAFRSAADAVRSALEAVSDDYSVQAYFGKRWFANAIRNVLRAGDPVPPLKPARSVAVTAAGPSLDDQLGSLVRVRSERFVLATDTSLPALLLAGIVPDAVVSIDCQHISYYHFMQGLPAEVPLFLDLASPPSVASLASPPRFFSGGHPFTVYCSRRWRAFPRIDTSGGNVTYAAVGLAEALGAEFVELYGADFSYPRGEPYSRGTYIHPLFQRTQDRFAPLEAKFASFVFRNETLKRKGDGDDWRYETKPLEGYRLRLERLAPTLASRLEPVPGRGAPIFTGSAGTARAPRAGFIPALSAGRPSCPPRAFLADYASRIASLPRMERSFQAYLAGLDAEQRDIMTTLLPTAAAIRRRQEDVEPARLLDDLKDYCVEELERVQATEA